MPVATLVQASPRLHGVRCSRPAPCGMPLTVAMVAASVASGVPDSPCGRRGCAHAGRVVLVVVERLDGFPLQPRIRCRHCLNRLIMRSEMGRLLRRGVDVVGIVHVRRRSENRIAFVYVPYHDLFRWIARAQ